VPGGLPGQSQAHRAADEEDGNRGDMPEEEPEQGLDEHKKYPYLLKGLRSIIPIEVVLAAAFEKNPSRFKHKIPAPAKLPEAVWINPPATQNIQAKFFHPPCLIFIDTFRILDEGATIPGAPARP